MGFFYVKNFLDFVVAGPVLAIVVGIVMTAAPKRFCAFPGCGVLVTTGYCDLHKTRQRYCKQPGCSVIVTDSGWCADHQPQRQHDQRRGPAAARGYDRHWQTVRAAYIAQFPLCGRCQALGLVRQADMVHHIVAIRDGGDRLAYNNLLSLCWACHGKVGPSGDSIEQVQQYKRVWQV